MQDIRLMIFDLDMCIFDTETQRPTVISAITQVLDMFEMPHERRIAALTDLRAHASPVDIALTQGFSPQVRKAVIERYRMIEMSPHARTFGDEHHIAQCAIERVLVTAGLPEVQNRKIDHVGIRHLFSEIYVDAIADDGTHLGKEAIFQGIMEARHLEPRQIVVLGDNPKTELGAGKNLGMYTVQTLRPGVVRWAKADFHITSFAELHALVGAPELV